MGATSAGRTKAFISYSHLDTEYLKELQTYLTYFERNSLIDLWVDTKIKPGQRWFDEIQQGLTNARVAIFLVSTHFLASEFIQREELPALLKAAEQEHVTLLVVVLDQCPFSSTLLADYQAVSDPKHPLNQMSEGERAKVWVQVAGLVREAVQGAVLQRPAGGGIDNSRPKDYLPLLPNPNFQPRPGEFEALEGLLFHRTQPVRLGLVGMVGMGGVGKTYLAVELAVRYRDLFPDGIFWMAATGSLFDWQHQFAELAEHTEYLPPDDVPGQSDNEQRRAKHFARCLATHPGALLILDNVEHPGLVVSAWPALVGRQPDCTLLYTSRIAIKPDDNVSLYGVEALPEEAALRLLLQEKRPEVLKQALAQEQAREAQAARRLCQRVGRLPLGLIHLRRLLSDPLQTVAGLDEGVRGYGAMEIASKEYQDARPLFATFALSWEQVQDVRARQLFYLASYFPEAAPIPLWLLGLAAGLGERWDAWGPLREARLILQDHSLLETLAEGQVRLHPLMREFARRLVAAWRDHGQELTQQAGKRLVTDLWHLNRLEQRARREGYWECLEQVRSSASYAALLGADQKGWLARLERWLDREGHVLGQEALWPKRVPGLFYHQLSNRAVEERQPVPEGGAPAPWLRQLEPVGAEDRALRRVLRGHQNEVTSVAFSPDGQLALTGSADQTAGVWEVSTGQELSRLEGHQDEVTSVAFSPDGQLALTGSADQTARVWEISTGRELTRLEGHYREVTSVAFSPDGRLALTGSEEKARVWEVSTGQKLMELYGFESWVTSVVFSPDGRLVMAGSRDQTAQIWVSNTAWVSVSNVALVWGFGSERGRMRLEGHQGVVTSVAFSPDGRLALTGSADGTARLWEVGSGRELKRLEGHQGVVTSVSFSPDGRLALTGSYDRTAWLWEVSSGRELMQLEGHQGVVTSVMFSPDGQRAVSYDDSGCISCWDLSGSQTGHLIGIYLTAYEVKAIYWHDWQHLLLADTGGPRFKPNFYRLMLEGI